MTPEELRQHFFNAIETGNEQELCELLYSFPTPEERKDFVNQPYKNQLPINSSIKKGQAKILAHLIEAGADLQIFDRGGRLPFHHAVIQGDPVILNQLIKSGAEVNQPTRHGDLPLALSIYEKKPLSTFLLIQAGANLQAIQQDPLLPSESKDFLTNLSIINPEKSPIEQINSILIGQTTSDKQFIQLMRNRLNNDSSPKQIYDLLIIEKQNAAVKTTALSAELKAQIDFAINYFDDLAKNPEIFSSIKLTDLQNKLAAVKQGLLFPKVKSFLLKKIEAAEKIKSHAVNEERHRVEIEIKTRRNLAEIMQQTEGYCNGLTVCWLFKRFQGEKSAQEFHDLVARIIRWDGIEDIDIYFEKLFANIEWTQNSIQYQSNVPHSKLSALLEDPTQAPIICEHEFSWLFTPKELSEYLKLAVQEERMTWLSSSDHAMGVIKRGGIFYFYNSNDMFGEKVFTSIDDIFNEIKSVFGDNYIPLSIKSFRAADQAVLSYIPAETYENELLKNKASVLRKLSDDKTALYVAALSGDLTTVTRLLATLSASNLIELSTFLNTRTTSRKQTTPLFAAVLHGHTKIVKLLLAHGADPTIPDKYGVTTLELAVIQGNTYLTQYLLEKGMDINSETFSGDTILIEAIRANHTDIIQYLISKGVDIEKPNKYKSIPLNLALENNNLPAAILLIRAGAKTSAVNSANALIVSFLTHVDRIDLSTNQRIFNAIEQYLKQESLSQEERELLQSIQNEINQETNVMNIHKFLQKKLQNITDNKISLSKNLSNHIDLMMRYLAALQNIQFSERKKDISSKLTKTNSIWKRKVAIESTTTTTTLTPSPLSTEKNKR